MKLGPLRYEQPSSVAEAERLLRDRADASPLAGGQSLIPALRLRERRASVLVDLAGLDELRGIEPVPDGGLEIGAGEPMWHLERDTLVAARAPLLARVLGSVGAVGIRTRATLGGSLGWADPTSQLPATLVALGARVATTRRTLPAEELLAGRHRTVLDPGELILRVLLPASAEGACHQVRRTHITWPAVGAVAARQPDGWRLVVYGVGSRPLLLRPRDGDVDAALAARMEPFDDERASASYRRQVAPVLASRALRELEVGA